MKRNKIVFQIVISCFFLTYFFNVFASSKLLDTQSATLVWSNNSMVDFSKNWSASGTYYVNKWDNSDIVWDFLKGFYYNSLYGFFELNRSTDESKNVKIISSTDACNSWYGYKLGWYAKSETVWLIDFDYNNWVFVYYCMDDGKLHWKAFSEVIGYQNFEWLSFDILPSFSSTVLNSSTDSMFVNNTTTIFLNEKTTVSNKSSPSIAKKEAINYGEESIFYIWKAKK